MAETRKNDVAPDERAANLKAAIGQIEKSFGKGVIQTTIELDDGSALKLTIMQYLSPNKSVINKKGVTPDVKVKDDEKTKTDEQLNKALEVLGQ